MSEDVPPSKLSGNKNWQRMWRGQAISAFGDVVFLVTIMLWIATDVAKGQSWAPAAVAGALIATAVPALVVGPVAGVWVDRWNRRRTMLVADAARVFLVAGLLVVPVLRNTISTGDQLAIVYVMMAAASSFAEFFNPARTAIIGTIVPQADQTNAAGQLQAVMALAQVLGPLLAAPLLLTFGVQWALIVNALSFGVSWLYVRAIDPPTADEPLARPRSSFGAEFRAGVRFFASNRVLVGLATGSVILLAGVGAINAVAVFFVLDNLGASAGWVTVIAAAIGAGAILGAVGASLLARVVGLGRLPWLGLLVGGIATIGLSRCTHIGPAIAASFAVGIATGIITASDQPITLLVTPSDMIGRVTAVFSPLLQLANLLGMALAGVLAGSALTSLHATVATMTFGPYDTILAGSGVLFILAALVTIRPLRHLPVTKAQSSADAETMLPALETSE